MSELVAIDRRRALVLIGTSAATAVLPGFGGAGPPFEIGTSLVLAVTTPEGARALQLATIMAAELIDGAWRYEVETCPITTGRITDNFWRWLSAVGETVDFERGERSYLSTQAR